MQRLRNLKKNPLEIEHTFLKQLKLCRIWAVFFMIKWLESLYLDTLVIT